MLLCFFCYLKRLDSKKITSYVLMMLSYAAALLSKESSLILPVLLLVYHYSFRKRIAVKELCSLAGLAAAYILWRVVVLKGALEYTGVPETTMWQRIPGTFASMGQYVKLLFIPLGLHMEYGHQLFPWQDLKVILGAVVCVLLAAAVVKSRKRDEAVFFSLSWFVVGLLPVLNLYPINAYMAEHWLYVPSIGFFLVAAKGINALWETKNFELAVVIVSLGLGVFYSYLTVRQNGYWKDPVALFERTVKYSPKSSKAYNNLGMAYVSEGRDEEAVESYKKSLKIDPTNVEAYINLGVAYAAMNKIGEAAELYKQAIQLDPSFSDAHYNLGVVYAIMNQTDEAISAYKEAIELYPTNTDAYFHLGVAYDVRGRHKEAMDAFRGAIELRPDHADAYNNLGIQYGKTGKPQEAIAAYKKAIAINPDFEQAYYNLTTTYFYNRQYEKAIRYYDQGKKRGFVNVQLENLLNPYRK
jgi:tetratricopeptide (TPR) repeat protein